MSSEDLTFPHPLLTQLLGRLKCHKSLGFPEHQQLQEGQDHQEGQAHHEHHLDHLCWYQVHLEALETRRVQLETMRIPKQQPFTVYLEDSLIGLLLNPSKGQRWGTWAQSPEEQRQRQVAGQKVSRYSCGQASQIVLCPEDTVHSGPRRACGVHVKHIWRSWRDGQQLKITGSSSWGPEFKSQHPHDSSQLSITVVSWNLVPFPCMKLYMQTKTVLYIKYINKP